MKTCEDESLARLLYITAQAMTVQAEKVLNPYDLTVEQLQLLKNMDQEIPLSQQQLCEVVEKSAANVTRILDRLQRKKCIRREVNPDDRRSTLLFLTPQGNELLIEVTVILESFTKELIQGISSKEQEIFSRLLHTMQANLTRMS